MSSTLGSLTMVVLWLAYSLASKRNSPTDVTGFSAPRSDRSSTDFQSSAFRRKGYTYTDDIGGHKYVASKATWEEARRICKADGGDLAIINSEHEADVISIIRTGYHIQDKSPLPEKAWIGNFIPARGQGEWQTIFGDSLTEAGYDQWRLKPSNSLPGLCGTILRDGRLHFLACGIKIGFVCEVPFVPPRAYKVHTSPKKWDDARKVCREEGGDLAVINSAAEADVIAGIFHEALVQLPQQKSYNPDNMWVGLLSPAPGQGSWQTIYGDSPAQAGYDEWYDAPEGKANGNCGGMFKDGGLSWWACYRELVFVCEGPYRNEDNADHSDSHVGVAAYNGVKRNARCNWRDRM